MTEHPPTTAVKVETLDWVAMQYYLGRNPDGAFYAVTNLQKVVWIHLLSNLGRTLMVDSFGAKSRTGFTVKTVTTAKPNKLQNFGYVKVILFVSRKAADLDDLATIAGPLYREAIGDTGPKYVVLDVLTKETLNERVVSYYLMVQKPSTNYPSVFRAELDSQANLLIHLQRDDANSSFGVPMSSPDVFNYKLGGEFVVRPYSATNEGKERNIGQILAIISAFKYLPKGEVYEALREAKNKPK